MNRNVDSARTSRRRSRHLLSLFSAFALIIAFVLQMGGVAQAAGSAPNDPTATTQTDSANVAIASPSGITNDTTVKLGAALSDPDSGDTGKLNVEVQPVGTSFTDTATDSDTLGAQGPHMVSVTRAPGTYHWQAQAEDQDTNVSAWVDGGTFRINAAPNSPAGLAQADDSGPLASGGVTNDTTPTFSGTVSDPDNTPDQTDTLQLEVELKSSGVSFDGTGTNLSPSVNDAQTASVTSSPLAPGKYHWRARTVDLNGLQSGWVNFGVITVDFRVNTPPDAPTSTTQTDSASATISSPLGITNDTTVKLGATLSDPDTDGDTVKLNVEVQPSGTSFTGTANYSEASLSPQGVHTKSLTLAPGTYHWRAQTEDQYSALSGWTTGGTFRINAIPNDPTDLAQTGNAVSLAPGGVTNDTTPTFSGTVSDPDNAVTQTDSLQLEVELKSSGTGFDGTGTHLSSAVNDTQTASVTWTPLSPGTYHWRARTVDVNGAPSGWVNFGTFRINAAPNVPTDLTQTGDAVSIAPGGVTNDTTPTFSGQVSDPDNTTTQTDTLQLEVELKSYG
ncbi:MAG: large repetitive protein, partial [Actinomycetota bacterium]|nr:large repetitive protein [Actinomycetota bacterium]